MQRRVFAFLNVGIPVNSRVTLQASTEAGNYEIIGLSQGLVEEKTCLFSSTE